MPHSILTPVAILIGITFALAAHAAPACTPPLVVPAPLQSRVTAICGINAPEDMEAMPDGKHIVISETPGAVMHPGNLALLDTATDTVTILARPRDKGPIWGDPACPDPGESAFFYPHGIHLAIRPGGAVQLLVVTHAPGERIEFYQLKKQSGTMVAAWRGCVANPGTGMFNDVSTAPHGGFVATVMFDKTVVFKADGTLSPPGVMQTLSGQNSGYLLAWAPGQTAHKLPGSDAPFNNGIQVTKDGKYIYFAAWTSKQLRTYDVAAGKTTAMLDVDFLPDNISVAPDGTYIAAGIPSAMTWLSCVKQQAAFCSSSFKIERWDPKSNKTTMLLDAPEGLMPGASVGLQVGHTLYIGSFSGDRVLKVRL
jgi:sugar lactone lactonase YvrE